MSRARVRCNMSQRVLIWRLLAASVILAESGAVVPPAAAQADTAFAVTNVTVIPMDRERVLRGQTVLIRHGRIAAIGPRGAVRLPADVLTIDGTGRYLIPGLVDAHVHYDEEDPAKDPHVDSINREYSALFLAAGVTEVLNLCGSVRHSRTARFDRARRHCRTDDAHLAELPRRLDDDRAAG